jgi:predicted DNA-binding transcriptional regulator AlpA
MSDTEFTAELAPAVARAIVDASVKAALNALRREPLIQPEWLSLQSAAHYTGFSESRFSEFIKAGTAPPSVLLSRNARRFRRSDLDKWVLAGGPSATSNSGDGTAHAS